MSDVPMKTIANCETGEVTVVPLSADEIAELDALRETERLRRAEEEAKALALAELKESAKAKLIAGTPLTEEEAAVIVL